MVNKKKRRQLVIGVILVTLIAYVPSYAIADEAIDTETDVKASKQGLDEVKEEQDLFVFPSMQMEGIAAASSNSHVPMVEVVYRGQPPAATPNEVVSTTVKTSEVITTSTPKPKPPTGGTWSFNSMDLTNGAIFPGSPTASPASATSTAVPNSLGGQSHVSWNPDSIDVTVNPNKMRKSHSTTTTRTPVRSSSFRNDIATSENVISYSTTTEREQLHQESALYEAIDKEVKEAVLASSDYKKWADLKSEFIRSTTALPTIPTITTTRRSTTTTTTRRPRPVTTRAPRTRPTRPPTKPTPAPTSPPEPDIVTISLPGLRWYSVTPAAYPSSTTARPRGDYDSALPVSDNDELEIQHEMNHFHNFPMVASSTKRVPREYTHEIKDHGTGGSSYQKVHLSEGKMADYLDTFKQASKKPDYLDTFGMQNPYASTTAPPFVPLSSTEGSVVSTTEPPIVFTLSPELQDKIPDGYELIPVEQLTNEYEVVPWDQVQNLLDVNVVYPQDVSDIKVDDGTSGSHGGGPTSPPPGGINVQTGPSLPPFTNALADRPSEPYKIPDYHTDRANGVGTEEFLYRPPPISPDLPTLFYESLDNYKPPSPKPKIHYDPVGSHLSKPVPTPYDAHLVNTPAKPVHGMNQYDPRRLKLADTNVIHFGSDFNPTTLKSHNINGYRISTPPTKPPYLKNIFNIFHTTTTHGPPPYHPSTVKPTPTPIPYSSTTTAGKIYSSLSPYSKVKYSTPKPTTVKSLHHPTSPPGYHLHTKLPGLASPTPTPLPVVKLASYAPPSIVSTSAAPPPHPPVPPYTKPTRRAGSVKDLSLPLIHYGPTSPAPVVVPHPTTAYKTLDPVAHHHHHVATTPAPPVVHHSPTPHPHKPDHHFDHLAGIQKAHIYTTPKPVFKADIHFKPHKDPHHGHHLDDAHYKYLQPLGHGHPHEKPVPHHHPHPHPPPHHPEPHVHHQPHHGVHGVHGIHQPHGQQISKLPPKKNGHFPYVPTHYGYHPSNYGSGLGHPPQYPPPGQPPPYPPPYAKHLSKYYNQTDSKENEEGEDDDGIDDGIQGRLEEQTRTSIQIDNIDQLRDALKKAGVGPGSSKRVYLVKEEDGETHVQISVPIKELFEGGSLEERKSEALAVTSTTTEEPTTSSPSPSSPSSIASTTTAKPSVTSAGVNLPPGAGGNFNFMEAFLMFNQMQKNLVPGQILTSGEDGLKVSNILISKEDDTERSSAAKGKGSGGLQMELKKLPLFDLHDLTRGGNTRARVSPGTQDPLQGLDGNSVSKEDEEMMKRRKKLFLDNLRRKPTKKPNVPSKLDFKNKDKLPEILRAVPTNRIFVPGAGLRFAGGQNPAENKDPEKPPEQQKVMVILPQTAATTPRPRTTTPFPVPSTTTESEESKILATLTNTLNGLVSSVKGLNSTMMLAMVDKANEIKQKEDPADQIKSLQIEIARLNTMVQDMRKQKQSEDLMKLFLNSQQNLNLAAALPTPDLNTAASTTESTAFNWFTSEPTRRPKTTTTTTSIPITTRTSEAPQQVIFSNTPEPEQNIDPGLIFKEGDIFELVVSSEDTPNKVNNVGVSDAQQQENFLRLTNDINVNNIQQQQQSFVAGASVSFGANTGDDNNQLPPGSAGFGSVEVLDVGDFLDQNQNLDQLPTYGASSNNNNQLPVQQNNNNIGFQDTLPTYGNSGGSSAAVSGTISFGPSSPASNNYGSGSGNQNQINFGTATPIPNNYAGSSNNNFGTATPIPNNYAGIPQNNFVTTAAPNSYSGTNIQSFQDTFQSDSLPTYGSSNNNVNVNQQPQTNYASSNNNPILSNNNNNNNQQSYNSGNPGFQGQNFGNNFVNNNDFRPSNPLNSNNVNQAGPNGPWFGANQQQQLLYQKQQQLQALNSQSQLTNPGTNYAGSGGGAGRPVRFPGDAGNRFDQGYLSSNDDLPNYYDYDYTDNIQPSAKLPAATSTNILAELSKYSSKPKNLIYRGESSQDPYIRFPDSSQEGGGDPTHGYLKGSNSNLELIMYPSGQLLLGNQEQGLALPGAAIGPHLRSYLSGQTSLQQPQRPHYVFAKKRDRGLIHAQGGYPGSQSLPVPVPAYERPTELFDRLLEGDEDPTSRISHENISDDKDSTKQSSGGLWPILVRTAKDDFNFVGNVLKTVLSRKR